ncbi:MAG: hypothetical protein J6A66_07860 [Alistipes sp.]|nr:hypothetical protein [Alistipes sp.]
MKKIFRLSALFCAMTFLVTSCTKDVMEEPQVTPVPNNSEVQFGARAGFENADESRTVYTGETYTVGNTTFERIDWVDYTVNAETGESTGDVIDIYSEEAINKQASYWVNDNSNTSNNQTAGTDEGYLIKTEETALQWGSNGSHTFYGVYPSNAMFGAMTTPIVNTFADGVLTATISKEQHTQGVTIGTTTDGHTLYEMKPDMRFAYMVAKTTVEKPQSSVSLSFVPCVTAIRVVLKHPVKGASETQVQHAMYLAAVELQGKGILGQFTADLQNWTGTYPTCTNIGDTETVQSINLMINDNNNQPILLQPGDELAFTVFVRPGANINASDLTVKFSSDAFQYKSKSLAQSTALIPAMKKSILKGLKLPMILGDFEFGEYSNWMSQLKPEAKLNRLSLPGTGGTFSYAYDGDDPEFYQQQTLTFDQQWNAGIRAFEIVCDRPSNASTSLANTNVDCNKESVGEKVGNVLTSLLTKTATIKDSEGNLSECAVLILTYQPHGLSPSRNASSFASSLKAMWNGLSDAQKAQIVQYTPDMTIGDAAGKVMIFARVNQNNEKDDGNFQTATTNIGGTNITLIDGCGTGKDRWGARGYKINGARAADISNSASDYLENYMKTNDYVLGAGATKGEADFSFNTNFEGTTVWYQEWARVIPQNTYKAAGQWNWWSSYPAIYWFESYNEKLQNAKDTFLKAINSQSTDKTIYINSLCGYLAGTDFTNSLVPSVGNAYGGDGGNIKDLADKLNPDFGGYIREVIAAQQSGPTGIIMMDYISNDPNAGASYYLPSVIISNNIYSGMVDTSGGNTGGGNNDQQQPGGGGGTGEQG